MVQGHPAHASDSLTAADLGGFLGLHGIPEPPFGLDLVLRSTDDRLNGTQSLVRKLLLWLTLACMP